MSITIRLLVAATATLLLFSFSVFAQSEKEQPTDKFAGTSTVYFYSLKTATTLGQVRKPVFLDDMEIADIRPETYFIARMKPGKHNFRLKNKKFGGIEMEFEAGKTYYVKMGWQSGGVLRPSGISLSPPESGAFDIKQLRPVDEKNIKDKTVVSREL